ncbi:CDP-glycerol glycerophosphotransferase family protein [Halobacillus faecis]
MNNYEKNYWSLYNDFLEMFKKLEYKGLSIPYMCQFRGLVRNNKLIKGKLLSNNFIKLLYSNINEEKELQQIYTEYKNSLPRKERKKMEGKIVLHNAANILRFPSKIIEDNFDPAKTIFIHDKKPTDNRRKKAIGAVEVSGHSPYLHNEDKGNLPSYYLNDFGSDVSAEINKVRQEARSIASLHPTHPLRDDDFLHEFDQQIKGIIIKIEETINFINNISVSCFIFSSTDYYQSRTISMVASLEGIPTISMQHSILASKHAYMPKIADVEAIYGHFEKEWYLELGVPKEALEIIGHPRFDYVNTNATVSKEELNKELGLDKKKKNILITVRKQDHIGKWKVLLEELIKQGLYNIIIKDFPKTTPHQLTHLSSHVYHSRGFHLYDLIHHCDLTVTYTSTVALEAMLKNKPVFILLTPSPFDSGYFNSLGETSNTNPHELAHKINKFFNCRTYRKKIKHKRRKFIKKNYPIKKTSIERLLQLLNDLS